MQLRVIAAIAAAFVFVATASAEARRYSTQTERSQLEDDEDRPAVRRKRGTEDATKHQSRQRSAVSLSQRNSNNDGMRGVSHRGVGDRPGA